MSSQNLAEAFKINLNQNLWGLVIAFAALGLAEHYRLNALFWLSLIVAATMTLSAVITTTAYTWSYCRNKLGK